MFRAPRAHHQERQIVSIQPLVTVTLCGWPCRVQVDTAMKKLPYLFCTVSCTVSRDDRTIKIMLIHQNAALSLTLDNSLSQLNPTYLFIPHFNIILKSKVK